MVSTRERSRYDNPVVCYVVDFVLWNGILKVLKFQTVLVIPKHLHSQTSISPKKILVMIPSINVSLERRTTVEADAFEM